MTEVKIYERKKAVYFSIAMNLSVIIICCCLIFFSNKSETDIIKYCFYAGLIIFYVYQTYVILKKKQELNPSLIISDFALEVTEKLKTNTYLWKDVLDWKIEIEDNTDYLILTTIEKNKPKINISFLDKTPFEIEQLIREIKKH